MNERVCAKTTQPLLSAVLVKIVLAPSGLASRSGEEITQLRLSVTAASILLSPRTINYMYIRFLNWTYSTSHYLSNISGNTEYNSINYFFTFGYAS